MSIIVDTREPQHIVSAPRRIGLDVRRKLLTVGDYILSADHAVERKTTRDFIDSMFSGSLFEQA